MLACQRCARTSTNIATTTSTAFEIRHHRFTLAQHAQRRVIARTCYRSGNGESDECSALNFVHQACHLIETSLDLLSWLEGDKHFISGEIIKNSITCLFNSMTTFYPANLIWILLFINIFDILNSLKIASMFIQFETPWRFSVKLVNG